MLNNYSFIKRAAISTDFETAKWKPSNIVKGWMEGVNKAWANKDNDNFLTKALKTGGRFLAGDLLLGTLKGALGTAEAPLRLALSTADRLRGKITTDDLLSRFGDSAMDAGMTALTVLTGGTSRVAGATALRGLKSLNPGTAARAARVAYKKTAPNALAGIKNTYKGKNLNSSQLAEVQRTLSDTLKNVPDAYKAQYMAKAINDSGLSTAAKRTLVKNTGLLNTGDIYTTRKALNAGNFGYKDRWSALKQNGASFYTRANDATIKTINSKPVVTAMLMPVAGMFVDPESRAGKVLNAPIELLRTPAAAIDNLKQQVSTKHVKSLIESGLDPALAKQLMPYNDTTGDFKLNNDTIAYLGKYLAPQLGLTEADAALHLRRMLLPNATRDLDLWPNFTNMFNQSLMGDSTFNTYGKDAKRRFFAENF